MQRRLILLLRSLGLASVVVILTQLNAGAGSQTVGVFVNDPGAYDGYTLLSAIPSDYTYLIDNEGRPVHSWQLGDGTAS